MKDRGKDVAPGLFLFLERREERRPRKSTRVEEEDDAVLDRSTPVSITNAFNAPRAYSESIVEDD